MECLETHYRLTEREFARRLKLTGIPASGAWRAYGLVTLALIPSIMIFTSVGALNSVLAFQTMLAFMVLATVAAFWWRTGFPKRFDETLILDEHQLTHRWGNSRTEWNWRKIEQIEERSKEVLFYSLGRPLIVPNRVFFGQLVSLRQHIERRREMEGASDQPPIELHREIIESNPDSPELLYRVTEVDLSLAMQEKFQRVSAPFWGMSPNSIAGGTSAGMTMETLLFGIAIGLAGVILVMVVLLSWTEDTAIHIQAMLRRAAGNELPFVAAGWILPVILIWFWSKLRSQLTIRAVKQKLANEDSRLYISPQGWTIVNRSSGTFGSWQDMTDLILSRHFLGFKMIDQLAYLIPKRIFDSPAAADRFVRTVLDYCSQREPQFADDLHHSSVSSIDVIETKNPYQSPQQ
jgi:hypothetical protein